MIHVYSPMEAEDTEPLERELNQARSKPDTVDWPVRTARTFAHNYMYNGTQYSNTETVFYISLPLDQHHISDLLVECPLAC